MIKFDKQDDNSTKKSFRAAIMFARNGGKKRFADFKRRISYLNAYGGKDMIVYLYRDRSPHSFGIAFHRRNEAGEMVPWMYGGLIYSESSDSWGVHT